MCLRAQHLVQRRNLNSKSTYHDGIYNLLSQVAFSDLFHIAQNHGRYFFRGEGSVFSLDLDGNCGFIILICDAEAAQVSELALLVQGGSEFARQVSGGNKVLLLLPKHDPQLILNANTGGSTLKCTYGKCLMSACTSLSPNLRPIKRLPKLLARYPVNE